MICKARNGVFAEKVVKHFIRRDRPFEVRVEFSISQSDIGCLTEGEFAKDSWQGERWGEIREGTKREQPTTKRKLPFS